MQERWYHIRDRGPVHIFVGAIVKSSLSECASVLFPSQHMKYIDMSSNTDQDQLGAPAPVPASGTEPHTSPDAASTAAAAAAAMGPALTNDPVAEPATATAKSEAERGQTDDAATATEHAETLSHVRSPSPEADEKITAAPKDLSGNKLAGAGRAVINQRETIPTTGKRIPTTKWEYITFCIFCEFSPHFKLETL